MAAKTTKRKFLLKRSHLLEELSGSAHLTQYDAVASINPDLAHPYARRAESASSRNLNLDGIDRRFERRASLGRSR